MPIDRSGPERVARIASVYNQTEEPIQNIQIQEMKRQRDAQEVAQIANTYRQRVSRTRNVNDILNLGNELTFGLSQSDNQFAPQILSQIRSDANMRVHMMISEENKNSLLGKDANGNFIFGNMDENGDPVVRRIQQTQRPPQPTAQERERKAAQDEYLGTRQKISAYEKQFPHVTTEEAELAQDPDYKKISAISDPEEQKAALESSDIDEEKKNRITRALEHGGLSAKSKDLENNLKVKFNQVYDPQGNTFKDLPKPVKPTTVKGGNDNALIAAGAKKDAAGRAFILKNPEADMTAVYAGKVSPQDQERMAAKYAGRTGPEKLKAFQADMKKAQDAYIAYYAAAEAHGTPKSDPAQQGGGKKDATNKKAFSEQDKQAIDWARSHPDDPRAAKILKLHGL